jgi:hypothetical protein
MVALLIAAFVGFVCQVVFAIASIAPRQQMVELVNPQLPVEQRFKSAGRHPGNPSVGLGTVYQRLHPDGPLLRRYRRRAALSFVAFLAWVGALLLYGYLVGR